MIPRGILAAACLMLLAATTLNNHHRNFPIIIAVAASENSWPRAIRVRNRLKGSSQVSNHSDNNSPINTSVAQASGLPGKMKRKLLKKKKKRMIRQKSPPPIQGYFSNLDSSKNIIADENLNDSDNNKKNTNDSRDKTDVSTVDSVRSRSSSGKGMPSVFSIPEEEKYDRYSAALAAMEGLRRLREAEIERELQGITEKEKAAAAVSAPVSGSSFFLWGRRTLVNPSRSSTAMESIKNRTQSKFLKQSAKTIKALGLTVSQFNQIGREVLENSFLKERVSDQAYLYRLASTVHLPRVPLLLQDELSSSAKISSSLSSSTTKHDKEQVQQFARSIAEIEELRMNQMTALCQLLPGVENFPPAFHLSDPNIQPFLHPEVKQACDRFPVEAEAIVKLYGLNSEDFNQMLDETKRNPFFRWRVQKYVEMAEVERRKKRSSL